MSDAGFAASTTSARRSAATDVALDAVPGRAAAVRRGRRTPQVTGSWSPVTRPGRWRPRVPGLLGQPAVRARHCTPGLPLGVESGDQQAHPIREASLAGGWPSRGGRCRRLVPSRGDGGRQCHRVLASPANDPGALPAASSSPAKPVAPRRRRKPCKSGCPPARWPRSGGGVEHRLGGVGDRRGVHQRAEMSARASAWADRRRRFGNSVLSHDYPNRRVRPLSADDVGSRTVAAGFGAGAQWG